MRRIAALLLGLLVAGPAFASDPVPGLMNQWQTITQQFGAEMVDQGAKLLFSLLALQLTINGIKALIKGEDLIPMLGQFVRTLLTTTVFFLFIVKAGTWFPEIIDSFNSIGGGATKTGPLDPGAIMQLGISVVESIRSAIAAKSGAGITDFMRSVGSSFQSLFVEIFTLLAFMVLAGQLALAMLRGYLWVCIGPILLGFGSLSYTKDIAVNTLKSGISTGVTILTCYVIAGVAEASVDIFNAQIASFTMDNWTGLWNCVGVAGLLALASWQVPKLANDFLNGSVSGGVGETMATAGVAAAAAAAVTGGVGGVLAQAGQSSLQTLGGLAQAGMSGLNSASDLGKTGLDAVGHAAKEVAGHGGGIVGGSVRNMLDTSFSSMKTGMDQSIGGRTSQSIDAARGGSISPSSTPGAGGATGNSHTTNTTNQTQPNGGTTNPNSADSSSFSGASSASIGPDNGAGASITNDELGKRLESIASGMNNSSTTAETIRDFVSYIPNEQQAVHVNANLGAGNHAE